MTRSLQVMCFIHRKTVILGGDRHHVFLHIFNRMVAAVVTKFHFDSLRTARQRQQLMTEADAKYRNIGFEEFWMAVIA